MSTRLQAKREQALKLLESGGIMTTAELRSKGVTIQTLRRLVADGLISCPSLGVYRAGAEALEPYDEWAQISAREPECVFVLVSAAMFHGITQEIPGEIQIGIPMSRGHPPRMGGDFMTPVEAIRWRQPRNLEVGIEVQKINGVAVRITSQERTIVDLYRYSMLNDALPGPLRRVLPETFYDALSKYLTPGVGNADPSALAAMAEEFAVGSRMRPLIEYAATSAPLP